MNNTLLIFLMLIIAMILAVIDQKESVPELDYQPWQVDRLDNGTSRVFGITLGKTTVQEANQIFANFAETRLNTEDPDRTGTQIQLNAYHDQLIFNGQIASVKLRYKLNSKQLQSLYENAILFHSDAAQKSDKDYLTVDTEEEISLLNTPIDCITFIPATRYTEESIREHLGDAIDTKQLEDGRRILNYPDKGLKIIITPGKSEQFIYSSISRQAQG